MPLGRETPPPTPKQHHKRVTTWKPRAEYVQQKQIKGGQLIQQVVTNADDQLIVDFLYNEQETRELDGVELQQVRATKHRWMDPGQLGYAGSQHWPTLAVTTQLATNMVLDPTRRTEAKRWGITHRRDIIVATDTIPVANLVAEAESAMTKLPAKKYFQLFVELGKDTNSEASCRLTGFPMLNKSDFPESLTHFIRNRFIPSRLWTDGAAEEDSKEVRRVLSRFMIADSIHSEPEHQYQNPAEVLGVSRFKRAWRTIELCSKLRYNFSLPIALWLYQAYYVVDILNHRASTSGTGLTANRTPIEKSGDPTPDLSKFRFSFGEPVVYHEKTSFPLNQIRIGTSLGPATSGNYLCQYILTKEGSVISRSAVESVAKVKERRMKMSANPTIELRGGEGDNPIESQTTDSTAKGNPITNQATDRSENEELAELMDEYEPASKEAHDERQSEHRDFQSALKKAKLNPTPPEGEIPAIYGQPCEFPDEDLGDEAMDTRPATTPEKEGEIVDMDEDDGEDNIPNPWLAGKRKNMYYVHKIVGRSDPTGEQVKVFPGLAADDEDHCQMTQRNRLSLEVYWGEEYEGQNTFEPFARLKESTPQLVAEYVRRELGREPSAHPSLCLRNAVKWANTHLAAADESAEAFIKLLDASGYFETDKINVEVEALLRGERSATPEHQTNKVRGELGASAPNPDPVGIFKIGVEENAKVQYGIRVPSGSKQAQQFELEDGTFWAAAAKEECVDKLCDKYKVFNIGDKGDPCPEGYQEIKLKIVYTNSPEGKIKARCCAVGCGVDSGDLNRYFCVVDHVHARAVMTVALANGLQIRVVDVKSAYVTCRAKEKVWIRSLPAEFGEHAGKAAIVEGNLYGLNTAGAVWACSCRAQLQKMGFTTSAHDGAVYYRKIQTKDGPQYEYICTFVDDLILMSSRMDELVAELAKKWEFKHSTALTQGVRYVGSDCKQDLEAKTLDISCDTYIQEALDHIEGQSKSEERRGIKTFNMPCTAADDKTPMLEEDHPESLEGEEAEFLNEVDKQTYQSYIGALQWCCTLCRVDIEYPVNALSSYNAAPRIGHARRLMRIWGYLKAHPKLGIRLDPSDFVVEPEYFIFKPHQREHLQIDYGDLPEEVDPNDPERLGEPLTLTGFADADHAHNKVDRRSTTGRVLLLGKGILSWKSKRQVGCEGSSYGSELRATADTARELRGLRMFLRGIGVGTKGPSVLFGDNAAALYAASNLATTIKVKHLSIDYHSTRELTAWGVIQPEKCPTEYNLADIMTKPTSKETFWRIVLAIMIYPGRAGSGVKVQRMTIC